MSSAERYAFFDLDYTLIPHDTLLLFCDYVIKKEPLRLLFVFLFAPVVPLAVLRLVRGAQLKRIFLSFLWKMPLDRLDEYARDFVRSRVVPELYPEMRAKLDEHKRRGDRVVLNTASPEFYVRYIAQELGVDACCATRLDLKNPMPLIPTYIDRNNKGMVKIDAMRALLPRDAAEWLAARPAAQPTDAGYPVIAEACAYSDSTADLPMLLLSGRGEVVHPGKKLLVFARARNWTINTPARGYAGSLTRYLDSLRQLFGLYGGRDLRKT